MSQSEGQGGSTPQEGRRRVQGLVRLFLMVSTDAERVHLVSNVVHHMTYKALSGMRSYWKLVFLPPVLALPLTTAFSHAVVVF